MKRILIGGVFIASGIWLINKLMKKSKSNVEKPEFDYINQQDGVTFMLNGVEIYVPTEQLEETYQHLITIRDNQRWNTHNISNKDMRQAFEKMTPEQLEQMKNTPIFQELSKFKPYQIDTTAINNLGKNNGQIPSYGFSQEQLQALINQTAVVPKLPNYGK